MTKRERETRKVILLAARKASAEGQYDRATELFASVGISYVRMEAYN